MRRYIVEDNKFNKLKKDYNSGVLTDRKSILELKATAISKGIGRDFSKLDKGVLLNLTYDHLYKQNNITDSFSDLPWFERNSLVYNSSLKQLKELYTKLLGEYAKAIEGRVPMFCDCEMLCDDINKEDGESTDIISIAITSNILTSNYSVLPTSEVSEKTKELLELSDDFFNNAITQDDLVGVLFCATKYSHGTLIFYGNYDKQAISNLEVKDTYIRNYALKYCFNIQPLLNIKAHIVSNSNIDRRLRSYMRGKANLSLSSLEMLCSVMPSNMHNALSDSLCLNKVSRVLLNKNNLEVSTKFIEDFCDKTSMVFEGNKLINTKFARIERKWSGI